MINLARISAVPLALAAGMVLGCQASDASAEPDRGDTSTAADTGAPSDTAMPPVDSGTPLPDSASPSDAPADVDAIGSVPADFLDLANWKLTLPVPGTSATSPKEVKQPELDTYSLSPYFSLDPGGFVVFQANAGGTTTSGSSYPRSELREMTMGGTTNAAWSTTSGTHTMEIDEAITHLPVVKPHVVAGQIHDAADDVVMIRLEGKNLFVEGGGTDLGTLDASYALGTRFKVKIVATGGRINVAYNGVEKVSVMRASAGCYFKAGVYTQSNVSKGDASSAYGEVHIYGLRVTHE